MKKYLQHILFADDDSDDRELFTDAVAELKFPAKVSMVEDGMQLLDFLYNTINLLPDLLFLDLNMPRINGFECLQRINSEDKFKTLPVVVLSTSYDPEVIKLLYHHGARYYIRKPVSFEKLKWLIEKVHNLVLEKDRQPTSIKEFVLNKD